jgi:hypothetical protein
MPQKFFVRGSLLPGQPFYCRAGRGWGSDPKLIEVIDQDECPKNPNRNPGLPDVPDPIKVGRKAYEILLKDPRISIKAEGAESAEAMASQVPGLQSQLGDAEAKIFQLEGKLELAAAEFDVVTAKLSAVTAERDAFAEKTSTLESLLGDATKPIETDPKKGKPSKA